MNTKIQASPTVVPAPVPTKPASPQPAQPTPARTIPLPSTPTPNPIENPNPDNRPCPPFICPTTNTNGRDLRLLHRTVI